MKTIGLIGGMSWESTIVYYRIINEEVQRRLGGVHSGKVLLHSFDFDDIRAVQRADDWDRANRILVEAGRGLVGAGADILLICTNTMHLCACAVEKELNLPLLHIADPLGEAIRRGGMGRVGLLGTLFTMERPDVLRGRLNKRFDLELMTPEGEEAREVDRIIFEELVKGIFTEASRARLRAVIAGLVDNGAEGIVLGCTELPLLVRPDDSPVPLFDTTALHAQAAVDMALK